MKRIFVLFLLSLFLASISMAEQVTVSFQPKNDSDKIDSVHVTNLTRGQIVKLVPGESVIFNLVTSAEHPLLNDAENGYLYPNPSSRFTTLTFNTGKSEKVYLTIYDIQGKMLLRKRESLTPGTHRFRLSFPAPGLYHVALLKSEKLLSYKALHTAINQQGADIHYLGSEALATDKNPENHLKSAHSGKSLDYYEGDVVHYTAFSGDNTTVIPDKPKTTKTIEVEFHECKDPDNRSYKIVQIGNQWWMAENLAYLPEVHQSSNEPYNTEPRFYVYGYKGNDVTVAKLQSNYTTYGVLYNWFAALPACPGGWHLPTENEWKQLEIAIGMSQSEDDNIGFNGTYEGTKLKATNGWNNNGNGTDDFGFSALPGGYCNGMGGFDRIGSNGNWWSSTSYNESFAWQRLLGYDDSNGFEVEKENGISVRCVRNSEESSSIPSVETGGASDIIQTSARIHGNVTSDGGTEIISRGFYWSKTNEEPGENDHVEVVEGGLGEYSQNITGLQSNTTCYYRAYATNVKGISTGSVLNFKTIEDTTDWPRDTGTQVVDVLNPVTGRTWMDRNLGASRAATGSTDAEAYGDLYQWGRAADGHQKRDSETTSILSSSDTPGHSNFILISSEPRDWRNTQNVNLWQGVNGINNPCPSGYRLPTDAELNSECQSWSSNNAAGAFASPLKLTVAGYRLPGGSLYVVDLCGGYWSSNVWGTDSNNLDFDNSDVWMYPNNRANGASVRCIKED